MNDVTTQFRSDISHNSNNATILNRWDALDLPDAWLVAGCLFQTVWNLHTGDRPDRHIRDYDLFYYDGSNLSSAYEDAVQKRVEELFGDLEVKVEASNQARVHLWYEEYFGYPYEPLSNSREGIDRFLVMETCVGISPEEIYAPYGLPLIYKGSLTLNPGTPHPELYPKKVESYRKRWPWLGTVGVGEEG